MPTIPLFTTNPMGMSDATNAPKRNFLSQSCFYGTYGFLKGTERVKMIQVNVTIRYEKAYFGTEWNGG
jgi:hypothetical protein